MYESINKSESYKTLFFIFLETERINLYLKSESIHINKNFKNLC
jgi:hypothetical protein